MKVLVIDRNYIGDLLMSSPVYRALRELDCQVDILTLPPSVEMAKLHPDVLNVYTGWPILKIRKEKYDAIVHLNTSLKTNLLMLLMGGKKRIGFNYRWNGITHTFSKTLPYRACRLGSRTEEVLGLIEEAFRIEVLERNMVLDVWPEAYSAANSIIGDRAYIGIHANCRQDHVYRRWYQVHFAQLADRLIEQGYAIVFTGSVEDRPYIGGLVARMKWGMVAKNMAGVFSLAGTAALIKRCRLFITLNTAAMHMSVAVGTPTLAIIGGTPPGVVYPYTDRKFRCIVDPALLNDYDPKRHRSYLPRINEITVDEVYTLAMEMLK